MTPWGLARVEVIASKEHIASELQRGVPVKQIYDALVSVDRVSVTYNSFRRQIQPIRDGLTALSVDKKLASTKRAPHSLDEPVKKQIPPPKPDSKPVRSFRFDPSCKAEDFF